MKTLCSHFHDLRLAEDGTIYREFYDNRTSSLYRQTIVPAHLRQQVASELYKGLNGGHLGYRRAKSQLRKRFYWPRWCTDVKLAKRRCLQCAKHQRSHPHRQGELQPLLTGAPWEWLGIDVTGPHPTSSKGNTYILTVIDHFTKWGELFPMRNQEASTVAKLLMDRVICVHGCPIQILTDQGPNFESQLFGELCRRMSIDKIRTSPYKPSTNGNIERFHATMHSMLAKWVSENQRDWDDKLPAVAFAYRITPQEATGYTPFFLQFGREARITADIVYGTLASEDLSTDEFVTEQQQRLHTAFEHTREHLGAAAKRRKHQYDLRMKPRTFAPGSWVWC